jgi:hypothetical protein
MTDRPDVKHLPEEQRKAIFKALVEAQDQEMTVAQSRRLIAQRYDLNNTQVCQIEREGLDNSWPPL